MPTIKRYSNRKLYDTESKRYIKLEDVAELIRREYGARYHVDHIGRLLRALGWTPQKPERRARERDEEAIRRWVKVEWPRIKKKPSA